MKRPGFHLSLAILLCLTGLLSYHPVQAGSQLVNFLKSQPCSGGWKIQTGYPPSATCWGLNRSVANTTLIPVPRAYQSAPQYPLVGRIAALGVDWDPGSFGEALGSTDIYRKNEEWLVHYRVEIQMRSLDPNGQFYNPVQGTNRFYQLLDRWNQVEWGYANTYAQHCPQYSLESLPQVYGGWGGCRPAELIQAQLGAPFMVHSTQTYRMDGAQADWFWLGSQISSKIGSAQKYGEPAFGVRVTTQWSVWARSNWDHDYQWDCHQEVVLDPLTGLPEIDPVTGDPITQWVCRWKDHGAGSGNPYTYLGSVLLNDVVVPGEGVQPLYPVPVFQSQPLLTVP